MDTDHFNQRLLTWFDAHGRKNLPWQQNPTPYRVWVSEIMLQQTQVSTVIDYYQRFMDRFFDLMALADAAEDEVLHLWSGLGYYARARNLHRAAQTVRDQYDGVMPLELAQLMALPGIGRSTAGAILALACGQRQPILDGNVKRVLARFQAVEGWPGHSKVQNMLWTLAERYTPKARVADYTQAIMDLGAMICTHRRPLCSMCPLIEGCSAYKMGCTDAYPAPRPRRVLPVRSVQMLMVRNLESRQVLLEKRPPTGIWGGLWGFPECPAELDSVEWCQQTLQLQTTTPQTWRLLRQTFSHFHLDITPVCLELSAPVSHVMESERFVWYNIAEPDERGLAVPVQKLLQLLATDG